MTALAALQKCLLLEHQALYAYGLLGGVLSGTSAASEEPYAVACFNEHRARRDRLISLISARGAAPTPAEPVYATPFPVTGVRQCRALARLIERRTAGTYAYAVAECTGDVRRLAAAAVSDAAVRDLRWGGEVTAFPGAPDLSS